MSISSMAKQPGILRAGRTIAQVADGTAADTDTAVAAAAAAAPG